MSQHTPGPWHVGPTEPGRMVPVLSNIEPVVVAIVGHRNDEQSAIDARLIAAAPELLDALRWFVNDEPCRTDHHGFCHSHGTTNCLNDEAHAVITKAEGRQS